MEAVAEHARGILICQLELHYTDSIAETYLFSGFSSATTHLTMPTLLLMAPPKTCHATAETKDFENPYPIHESPTIIQIQSLYNTEIPMGLT